MHYINLAYNGRNPPHKVTYAVVANGGGIGACCGSDWIDTPKTRAQHRGIVVSPENVEVSFRLKKDKYTTEQVVTKNGTFNVSIRGVL